jgi:hypothetical protein
MMKPASDMICLYCGGRAYLTEEPAWQAPDGTVPGYRYALACRSCQTYGVGETVTRAIEMFRESAERREGRGYTQGSVVTISGELPSNILKDVVEEAALNLRGAPLVLPPGVTVMGRTGWSYESAVPRYTYELNNRQWGRPAEDVPAAPVTIRVQKNRGPALEQSIYMANFFQQVYGPEVTRAMGIPERLLADTPDCEWENYQEPAATEAQVACPCCRVRPLQYQSEQGRPGEAWYRVWCSSCRREGWASDSLSKAIEVLQDDDAQRIFRQGLEESVGISLNEHFANLDQRGAGLRVPLGLLQPGKKVKAKLRAQDLIPAAPLTLDPEVEVESITVMETEFILDPEVEPEDDDDE